MKLHELAPPRGAKHRRKRVARGIGSGHGGTACRGHKGQKSRSGGGPPPGFEGGQMPLQRRLPKRGFSNRFRKAYRIVHLKDLDRFSESEVVDAQALKQKGVIGNVGDGVKVLGDGNVSTPLTIRVARVSRTAREKIEAAGGRVELI